jgi:hypothetical protein
MKTASCCVALACALVASLPGAAQAPFQQRADITMEVRLDDVQHMLHGAQTLVYTNNAPVALDTLWIHLWPNAYRDRSSALNRQMLRDGNLDLHFATEADRGWIDSLDFKQDGSSLIWGYHSDHADIAWVALPQPLGNGKSITINTPFRVKIPDSRFSRLGRSGQAYHITQWFPKPAVYDQDGWHPMPYLTIGEFYSSFGRYDVSITLPANYVVGATGLLQDNPEEEAWMDMLARTSGVIARQGDPNDFPPSDSRAKTLRFVQDSIHDFAWFADKRFIVRKDSVVLERSGRTVTTWALFTPRNSGLWERIAIESLNESLKYYSRWVGDYPYAACTAVDGTISAGGGMEYPMVTIIGNMYGVESLDNVIAHEVGHNWFYGILASNERQHPWMDEGMNSFVEKRYMRERYPGGGLDMVAGIPGARKLTEHVTDGHRWTSEAMYRLNARRNLDQAIEGCAHDYTQINYGTIVYAKSALVFDQLFAYLGEEVFDRCMRAYFEEWKFRHPRPEDVRRVFERESGQDLAWAFGELMSTTRKVDVKALKLRGDMLTYRSNAREAFPFPVTAWRDGRELGTEWFEGGHGRNTIRLPWADADRIRVDAGARTLDIDRRNNAVRSRGLLRRHATPQVKGLLGLEHDERRSVYWSPLAAWNQHDGFQVGLAAYNTVFPSQRTELVVAPLYSFINSRVGGAARIEHHFDRMQSRVFQNISVGLSARSQGIHSDPQQGWVYEKVSPYARFDFKRDPLTKPWKHSIVLRAVYLNTGQNWIADPETWPADPARLQDYGRFMGELRYTATDDRKLGPTRIEASVQAQVEDDDPERAGRFVRTSLEVERGFTYNAQGKQLRLRAFGGAFLHKYFTPITPLEAWGLSWGPEDMFFDHAYFDRGAFGNHFFGRQFNKQQGAFKTPFLQGRSDDWIAALNMELDLPLPLPLSIFASSGWVPTRRVVAGTGGITISDEVANYLEAGIGLQLVRDVLEVWVPLWVSERIADEEEFLGRGFGERIRFVFALERLDPTKALRKVKH